VAENKSRSAAATLDSSQNSQQPSVEDTAHLGRAVLGHARIGNSEGGFFFAVGRSPCRAVMKDLARIAGARGKTRWRTVVCYRRLAAHTDPLPSSQVAEGTARI